MRPGNSPGAFLPQAINKRLLYAALFLVGFALRFGFCSGGTPICAPRFLPAFGAEICQIAKSIVEGRGYSSPFFGGDTGQRHGSRRCTVAVCGVFRLFGVYSVASAVVLLFLQC